MTEDLTKKPIKSGNDRVLTIRATYPDDIPEEDISEGDPFSLAGKSLWFTAKREFEDADADAVIRKSEAAGITVRPAPDDNVADVAIDGASTHGFTESTNLHCDLTTKVGTGPSAKVQSVWDGRIRVELSVTRDTEE